MDDPGLGRQLLVAVRDVRAASGAGAPCEPFRYRVLAAFAAP